MLKWGLLALLFSTCPLAAGAQTIVCDTESDLASLVRCTGKAAALLPEERAQRVYDELLDTAYLVGGASLKQDVAGRLPQLPESQGRQNASYPDYGWQAARELLMQGGTAGLLQAARQKSGALRYGRAEALLAVGIRASGHGVESDVELRHLLTRELATMLNDELLSLAAVADEFERGDLAHAAAKLAAYRCDIARFEQARAMTAAPEALRYDFWRARITGDRSKLPLSIAAHTGSGDSRPVRQALEGIAFLAEVGGCGDGG